MDKLSRRFKALIVDFDGTLVDTNFNLSSKVNDAISNLINEGYVFSIATGRPYQGIVKKTCKRLKIKSPQIVNGGARIIDPISEKVIWAEYFPAQSAKDLINYFLKNDFDFAVEEDKFVFTLNGVDKSKSYGHNISFKDIGKLDYNRISKVVLFNVSSIGDPQKIEENLGSRYPDLHFTRSGRTGLSPSVLDITSAKATKHLAILELSKILNIDPFLMVGIGDGYNDYPLLSVCGFKVAMENAPDELKEIADLVVPDVENDGLAVAISKIANL